MLGTFDVTSAQARRRQKSRSELLGPINEGILNERPDIERIWTTHFLYSSSKFESQSQYQRDRHLDFEITICLFVTSAHEGLCLLLHAPNMLVLHNHASPCQLTIDRGWNYMAKSNVLTLTPHRSTAIHQVDHFFCVQSALNVTRVHIMFFALLRRA